MDLEVKDERKCLASRNFHLAYFVLEIGEKTDVILRSKKGYLLHKSRLGSGAEIGLCEKFGLKHVLNNNK
jgi:hypothetical protein